MGGLCEFQGRKVVGSAAAREVLRHYRQLLALYRTSLDPPDSPDPTQMLAAIGETFEIPFTSSTPSSDDSSVDAPAPPPLPSVLPNEITGVIVSARKAFYRINIWTRSSSPEAKALVENIGRHFKYGVLGFEEGLKISDRDKVSSDVEFVSHKDSQAKVRPPRFVLTRMLADIAVVRDQGDQVDCVASASLQNRSRSNIVRSRSPCVRPCRVRRVLGSHSTEPVSSNPSSIRSIRSGRLVVPVAHNPDLLNPCPDGLLLLLNLTRLLDQRAWCAEGGDEQILHRISSDLVSFAQLGAGEALEEDLAESKDLGRQGVQRTRHADVGGGVRRC